MAEQPDIPDKWSKVERWVWECIEAGEIADLNKHYKQEEPLDPSKPDGWDDQENDRRISQAFLEAILLHEPWRGAIHRHGVWIFGGLYPETIYLENAKIGHQVWLDQSRFEGGLMLIAGTFDAALSIGGSSLKGDVDLSGAKVGGLLSMNGSSFEGAVIMDGLEVAHGLFMGRQAAFKGDVDLGGAKVGGLLNMNGSSFEGAVIMDSLVVARGLFMREQAAFKGDVRLNVAKVGGTLDMDGSSFEGAVSMDSLEVVLSLFMREQAAFKGAVNLNGAKVGGTLDMDGSSFEGAVIMDSLEVALSLFMRKQAAFKGDVNLNGAKVGGLLDMAGSSFEGAVNMNGLVVARGLFMREQAAFKGDVNLNGAKVGGTLDMIGSSFEGAVIMDSLEVALSLFMREQAAFKGAVNLDGAKIGGTLDMAGSSFGGAVSMNSLEVAFDLLMKENATFAAPVDLLFGRLGGNLDLSGAHLAVLDLTGTQIARDLRLGTGEHPRTEWKDAGRLVLRNTHAGALQDRIDGQADAWPKDKNLQLDGFTYDRLGGFKGGRPEADMMARPVKWYKGWLERDPTYSLQPYEQLSETFRAAGHPGKANDILYAGRERERNEATGLKWWGLSLLKWTIGYGLGVRYFWSLGSVALLVAVGAGLLWLASDLAVAVPYHGFAWSLACSLDLLLPVVELSKAHAEFVTTTVGDNPVTAWIKYYFYVHKLFGWVLASFLVAGLAGLTQKS